MEVTAERKTQFFSLVRHNKVPEVEDQLNKGFPIDARDPHGNTPLMVAAQNGHKRLCKLTLKFGADANSTNHQVWVASEWSCRVACTGWVDLSFGREERGAWRIGSVKGQGADPGRLGSLVKEAMRTVMKRRKKNAFARRVVARQSARLTQWNLQLRVAGQHVFALRDRIWILCLVQVPDVSVPFSFFVI